MVSHSPALEALRGHILGSGSAFLRNVQWTPSVTCMTCAGIPRTGYDECYACASRSSSAGLADKLGFVTYGWRGGQAGHVMHAYKANGATSYELVSSILTYAAVAHWDCIAGHVGSHPDGWAYVPSLAGRQGAHPLAQMASRFMGSVPHVQVSAKLADDGARQFNPDHFSVAPVAARHVLLFDDTWTTGGHLQSASAALKAAGVERVTGLVIARWLDPSWGATRPFIDGLTEDFDPALCPYTGAPC